MLTEIESLDLQSIENAILELNKEKNAILRCIANWRPCSELVERTLNTMLDDEWHEEYRTHLVIRGVRYSISEVVKKLNPTVYEYLLDETRLDLVLDKKNNLDYQFFQRELEHVKESLQNLEQLKARHFAENNAS